MELTNTCGRDDDGNPLHFGNCVSFKDNHLRKPKAPGIRLPGKCPTCDLDNDYDGNKVRVVTKIEEGMLRSKGPAKKPVKVVVCTIL